MSAMQNAQMHYLQGCDFITLIGLIWDNRKQISPKHFPKLFFVTLMSLAMTPVAWIENFMHARKIAQTKVEKPPIFIVGHWRSGTTYLTNILACDKSKTYFTAEKTYTHNVFITLGSILRKIYPKVLPKKRPMDNMKMGADEPAEEVFALGNLTKYSIIHMLSFPKNARFYAKCAFYDELDDGQKKRVKKRYDRIIKKLTYYTNGKQLVVKSPDNTCRINMLLELYPDAKFIHIYRNPYKVYKSTLGMYESLFPIFAFEDLSEVEKAEAEDVVLDIYEKLYEQYLVDKNNIPKNNLIEIKYEDFVQSPKAHMEKIYADLEIGNFAKVKDNLYKYIDAQKGYKTNNFTILERNKKRINNRMKFLFDQYGYQVLE